MARLHTARALVVGVASVALCGAGQTATASASSTFDSDAFSTCTLTTVPGPDQNLDIVVTNCCAQAGGVTAATSYGLGCVAVVDNPPEDYRPVIVMPMLPEPPEDIPNEFITDEMIPLP